MNLLNYLENTFTQALHFAGAEASMAATVRVSSRPQFGDYQVNGVMAAAKTMKMKPRDLAAKVIEHLPKESGSVIGKTDIAGPGFINIFLSKDWLEKRLLDCLGDNRQGVPAAEPIQTVVVDYSAPNVAKEMHVAHLRSTVIGDCIVKTLEFLGNRVIRANHIGDWGTQFGMLTAHLEDMQKESPEVLSTELADLEEFYRAAKRRYDSETEFAKRARLYVVKLQSGDEELRQLWNKLVDITMEQNQRTYDRLNVSLTMDDIMGESLYNDMLPKLVSDLLERDIATEDDGASVVYLNEFTSKDGTPMGVIIRKRDGGYLYTTTDIACARYRYETLGASRMLYYIDARQSQHLQQAWAIVRQAGYVPDNVSIEHHAFGMMLGKDGKPFKTRAGGVVKLADLLDEAEDRAARLIAARGNTLTEEQRVNVIRAIAIGSVKYSDLSKNRTSDYVFDWENMLSFEGNTAPYILYAYTRIRSIFRKSGINLSDLCGTILVDTEQERALAVKLTQFTEIIQQVARDGTPHILCAYLYELAGLFMSFYENCPVNKEELERAVKESRLQICALTANIIRQGLELLGIETVEQM